MRRLAAIGTTLAVVLSVLVAMPAAALAPSLHFTADALPTWQTNGTVWGMAAAQGKVYAGGSFSQIRPPGTAEGDPASLNRAQFVVLDAVTGAPTSCVIDVTRGTSTAIVRAVTTSPDKATVYIGGLFETVKGTSRRNVAAIDVATCTVKSFNPQPSSFVYALAATADTLYFGGNFASVGGQARSRLGAASVAAANYGAVLPWAPTTDDEVFALAVDPTGSGNVIIGGRSGTINGQDSHALGVVDGVTGTTNIHNYPKGFFPWTPGTGQRTGTSVVKTIAVDAAGFYVGNEGAGSGIFDGRAAFDWGTYEQRWRNLCLGATQSIAPVDGLLYSASHGHNCEAEGIFEDGARHFFSAETAADKQVQPWWPQADNGIGEGIGPRSIIEASTDSGDYLWSGGEFTQINGVPQRGLTHFGQGPDTGAPATPQTPNVSSTSPGEAVVTWRSTLDDDDKTLTYTLYRGTSATPIATLQADSQFYSRPQLSFTDTGLTPGQSYSYRVKASDGTNVSAYSLSRTVTVATADAAYPSRIRSDGATVYFRMDEPNGTAAGSLGSGPLGGSYVNASTRTDQDGALLSSPGTSALFDGVSSFVRTEVPTPAPTVYTIESWIKTTTTRGGKIVGYANRVMINGVGTAPSTSAGGKYDRQIYMTNDGKLTFGTNTPFTTLATTAAYNDGQWHQVVASQGPAGMALYVDGVRVARNTVTTAGSYSGFWRIGGDTIAGYPNRPTSDFFGGNIDETAIYDKVLTPTQIADHYRLSGRTNPLIPAPPTDNYGAAVYADGPDLFWRLGEASGGTAIDASGNNSAGTYGSTVTRSVPSGVAGTADTAISTTGAATGIVYSAASSPSPTTFSEELWFKTATTTGGKLFGFGNSQTGTSSAYDKHIYMGTDGKVRFGVNGGVQVITSPNAYNNNAWHHVVATQDATGTKLYLDGAQVASGTATTNQNVAGFWRVGGDNLNSWPNRPTTDYFTGSIDEVAVYTKALTAAQVQSHFALGASGPASDTQAPTVPSGVAAAATGSTVNVSWTASTDNVGVTKYEVHRSATAGFTADTTTKIADVSSGVTYADAARPAGTWYYRVAAADAAGNTSAASSAASVVVAPQTDTQVPVAPSTVGATVANQDVSLSWSGASDNVGVTGYEVHRSATSGFTPSSATKIGTVSGASFTDTVVTGGTWFYKVIAVDAAGNQSLPSTQASAVVAAPADTTAPTVPSGLQANVSGTTVALTWTASTDTVGVAGYDVYRSATAGFTPDATTKIGSVASGTTFSDTARPVGTWYYRVLARDAAGNASAPSSQATAVVSGGAVQTVVLSPTEDSYAVQGTPTTTYGSSTSMNSRGGSSSFAPYLKFTLPAAPAGTSLVGASLSVRTTTDAAAGSVDSHVVSLSGASSWTEAALTWNNRPAVGTTVGSFAPPTVPNTRYNAVVNAAALAALPAGAVTLAVSSTSTDNFQFWSQNFATATYRPTLTLTYQPNGGPVDTEVPVAPSTVGATVANQDVSLSWSGASDNVGVTGYEVHRSATSGFTPSSATKIGTVSGASFTDTVVTGGTWFYKVIAVDAAGNQSLPSTQASAVVAAPADTTAPTVPSGLQANVSGTTVALTWTASTDTVGVAGYDVYRSATAGFTPDATTKIGSVASGTTFSDTARPVGTWYYRVLARDAAGNASAPSSQATAVVSGGAVQTVVLSPTEDSYAVQGTPTTTYGSSTSMNSRGGSSSFAPYLKFTLPAAPAGTSLVGASLSVRTTTDAAAGSVDSHVVSLSGASSWTEAALTWNNRPAVGTTVGSFAPPTVPNTRYNAVVNAAALAALPAGAVTLAVSSTSTDNFQFWSQNFATATYRPTLTLTYQAN